MGRKKLPMKLISNNRARLVSFEKRKKGLKKAAYELSTLCRVDIGMIIGNTDSNETMVWPEGPDPVARMIELIHGSSSDQERRCKKYGVSDYFKEHREGVEKQIKKMREKIIGKDDCEGLSHDQLRELGSLLSARIVAVRERISLMKAGSGVLMDQESRVFAPGIGEEQQPWTYFGGQDNMGSRNMCSESMFWRNSSLMQESIFSILADDVQEVQEQQHLVIFDDVYNDLAYLVEGSRNEVQEVQEQQNLVIFDDIYNDLAYLVEGSRNPYSETNLFPMNQSVQGTATLMPDIIQQQQHVYYEAQNNMQN